MPINSSQLEQLFESIEDCIDSSSNRFGRLLNWQNPNDPFWHYGIGLSDKHIFDTGQGACSFEREDAKFVIGIDDVAFEPAQTIERMKHALKVFSDWDYNFIGWNCEHLARLIATDQPRCYQSVPLWWLGNMSPDGEHKTAHQIFRAYLMDIAPNLVR